MTPLSVVVATPFWTLNGVNVFSANLVRGLRARGVSAEILLTEEDTRLVSIHDPRLPFPDGVPFTRLPVGRERGWGAHWGAMARYLESRAPCIYIPNSDWRHSCVTPLLADGVGVVGVVHSDDPLHYDHVRRLGASWNAIVCVSKAVAEHTVALDPTFAARTRVIPIGVRVAPNLPPRLRDAGAPLRVIYHGLLTQRQKRILDLPEILDALEARGVPVELTVAGGGAQSAELREACRRHEERGAVRFVGVLANSEVLELLERQDVFLMTSEFEGMPNALLEAMGRGCVPVVTRTRSGIPELVRDDGSGGFLVDVGAIDGFVEGLARLHADPAALAAMSRGAYEAVAAGPFHVDQMVGAYIELFERVGEESRSGAYRRPAGGLLTPPPSHVAGIGIFPVPCTEVVEGVGPFPSKLDASEFFRERGQSPPTNRIGRLLHERRRARLARERAFRVTVALPYWTLTGVTTFTANLVRGLVAEGIDAEVLLTEQDTELITIPDAPMPMPTDIPIRKLAVGRGEKWGAHWAEMIHALEDRAPAIYIPNYDWRHSCVGPLLSPRVGIVGVLHGDDPLHYDHLKRQQAYWNAVVAVSDAIAERVLEIEPSCAPRLSSIPYGIGFPARWPERRAESGARLKLIYHGVLNTRQKRILDLVGIVEALVAADVPVELTIVGGGPDERELAAAARTLTERGIVRFLGVRPNGEIRALIEEHDVFLMTSGFEGLPNALLEAMGSGCVPVVTDIRSGIPELVKDGVNGYLVPIGRVDLFAERLGALQRDPALRVALSRRAHETICKGAYRTEDMVAAYLALFQRVLFDARRGAYRRPPGLLHPPPANVAGVDLFPVDCVDVPELGRFPRGAETEFRIRRLLHRAGPLAVPFGKSLRWMAERRAR